MDSSELRTWCLRQPGAIEDFPFGPEHSVFKVAGKMFALSALERTPLEVSVKCEPELAVGLRDSYSAIRPGYHLNKRHWNTITLDGSLPDQLVRELVEDSYDLVVSALPRRIRDELGWAPETEPAPSIEPAFRRGTAADAPAAADLWLRARKAAREAIPEPVHSDDDVRAWFASHVVGDAELWLAEAATGTLAGILVLDGPWVDQLYVEPSMTGRGIGAGLLALAKRERPAGLRLWTFASNPGAQRFYERHGFVATRRTDGRDNEEGAPDILYVWAGQSRSPR